MGESFGQLATVSAFLAGFVFTFLGVLVGSRDTRRRVGFTLSVCASSSACLLLAALGWALLSAQGSKVASSTGAAHINAVQKFVAGSKLTGLISELFLLGIALMVLLLGTSGWLRSRRVGVFTMILAAVMALALFRILSPFATH